MENEYDYIIAGAGCAGLSLAYAMSIDSFFNDKKILLIDKEQKTKQDRTWCFWDKDGNAFDEIITKEWSVLEFFGLDFAAKESILPYKYKMIRSEMFYNFCLGKINKAKNITALQGDISAMKSSGGDTYIEVNNKKIYGTKIFSSILLEEPLLAKKDIYLLQHFKGLIIETHLSHFDSEVATLMDFRIPQDKGTAFVYTLPLSATKALVEYTLFSEKLLPDEEYGMALDNYIKKYLKISHYAIVESEFGVIPMTNYKFKQQENEIYFIGTAGGASKPSSGYTFTFIQKQVACILQQLTANKPINLESVHPKRFLFYDEVLLHLLQGNELGGAEIFTKLFKGNSFQTIFSFLHNETNIWQEIKLMNTVQRGQFMKAVLQRII
jgi:lycopene beta-cyclase